MDSCLPTSSLLKHNHHTIITQLSHNNLTYYTQSCIHTLDFCNIDYGKCLLYGLFNQSQPVQNLTYNYLQNKRI